MNSLLNKKNLMKTNDSLGGTRHRERSRIQSSRPKYSEREGHISSCWGTPARSRCCVRLIKEESNVFILCISRSNASKWSQGGEKYTGYADAIVRYRTLFQSLKQVAESRFGFPTAGFGNTPVHHGTSLACRDRSGTTRNAAFRSGDPPTLESRADV